MEIEVDVVGVPWVIILIEELGEWETSDFFFKKVYF